MRCHQRTLEFHESKQNPKSHENHQSREERKTKQILFLYQDEQKDLIFDFLTILCYRDENRSRLDEQTDENLLYRLADRRVFSTGGKILSNS